MTTIGVPPSAPQIAAVAPSRPLPSPAVYTPPAAPGSSADAPAPLVRPGFAAQLPEAADAGTLAQRAAQYFNEKNYAAALDALERRAAMAPETTELRMMRGWSLLHLNRKDEARNAFATLGKAAPGQSLQGGK